MTPEPLMSISDVAKYLNVSISTVERMIRARAIPSSLVGSQRRFRLADVLYYVASRTSGNRDGARASQ